MKLCRVKPHLPRVPALLLVSPDLAFVRPEDEARRQTGEREHAHSGARDRRLGDPKRPRRRLAGAVAAAAVARDLKARER